MRRGRRSRSAQQAIDRAYPEAIDLVVLAVRAGHLPAAAIEATLPYLPPPVRPGFAAVTEQVRGGVPVADALAVLPDQLGPRAGALADSLAAADRYGLPLTPVLERLAAEARAERRRQQEIAARQLPVRLSAPLVLCTLPSFVLLAIAPLLLAALSSLDW
jgi:Flp pilus assembly protein TadB